MATSAGEEAVVESEVQVVGTPTTDGEGQLPGTSESIAPISAVVIGGTGATGRCLVGLLLKDKTKYGKVTVVGRRKVDTVDNSYGVNLQEEETSGRLIQVEQDMDAIDDEAIQRICTGAHVCFNCLGTTRRVAGSAERFHQIDHDIPLKFAKAAKAVGVSHFSQLSSFGAKSTSMFLYLRTKGELDEAVMNLKFDTTSIVRPKALDRGGEKRFFEKIAAFFGSMPVSTLAEAMAIDAFSRYSGPKSQADNTAVILGNTDIYRIVEEAKSSVDIGSSVDPPGKEPEIKELSTEANESVANKNQSPGTPEASNEDNSGVHEEGKGPDSPVDQEKVDLKVKEEGKEEQASDENNICAGEDKKEDED